MNRISHRSFRFAFACLLFLLCGCSRADEVTAPVKPQTSTQSPGTPIPTALDDYIARPEANYKWEKVEEQKNPQNTVTILKLVSQTWQGKDWTHRVEIIRPAKVDPEKKSLAGTALVLVSFGSPQESLIARLLATQIGATVINVNEVPNQPLFGLREDALIAYSFKKYIETGDSTWPLLLPMTKSVVKAMDAVQEYSQQNNEKPIEKFIVGGASKRGWTSWLVAAADSHIHPNRVAGIIPIVYNNLNIPKQLPHQLESWGKYSEMIGDYTKLGLQDQTGTSRGAQLIGIVDPYTYRARFTMPKLLINGANDRYWTPDATKFYLNDLPGSTSLYFAPNSGHDLASDYPNVLSTASAWFRLVASGKKIPFLYLYFEDGNRQGAIRHLKLSPSTLAFGNQDKLIGMKLWWAVSQSQDFRDAKWQRKDIRTGIIEGYGYPFNFKSPTTAKFVAAYGEMEIKNDTEPPLKISTPIQVWKAKSGH